MEVKKNKCGRPRKEPTYTKGFRLHKSLKDFFQALKTQINSLQKQSQIPQSIKHLLQKEPKRIVKT